MSELEVLNMIVELTNEDTSSGVVRVDDLAGALEADVDEVRATVQALADSDDLHVDEYMNQTFVRFDGIVWTDEHGACGYITVDGHPVKNLQSALADGYQAVEASR